VFARAQVALAYYRYNRRFTCGGIALNRGEFIGISSMHGLKSEGQAHV
jgi:hypothetical protein